MDRLKKQLDFIIEIDKVKNIMRKTRLFDGSRRENDSEHSWHIALMAFILSEFSNEKIDISKVIKMLLIHDIPEIYAGDTFLYSPDRSAKSEEKEKEAACKIFGMLPEDQKNELLGLWVEFEKKETKEAKFAAVLDRLEPLMQNYLTKGMTWKEFNIKFDQVINANKHIEKGSLKLWEYAKSIINESVEKGYLGKS